MKASDTSTMQDDTLRLLHGSVETLRTARRIASQIETDCLHLVTPSGLSAQQSSTMQQMDLLQQSLAELERLMAQAAEAVAQSDPLTAVFADVRLDVVRTAFAGPTGRQDHIDDNPLITLFD